MAWIESHQSLERHPKTLLLRRVTLLSHNETLGLLHRLWWWALDNAQDGNVTDFCKKGLMEEVFGIPEKEEKSLAECLIESGWLDKEGDQIVIHNHGRYRNRLTEMRERNKLRQKEWRERRKNKGDDNITITLRNVTNNRNNAQQDITRQDITETHTHSSISSANDFFDDFEASLSNSYEKVISIYHEETGKKGHDRNTKEGARILSSEISKGHISEDNLRYLIRNGMSDKALPNQSLRGVATNYEKYLPKQDNGKKPTYRLVSVVCDKCGYEATARAPIGDEKYSCRCGRTYANGEMACDGTMAERSK